MATSHRLLPSRPIGRLGTALAAVAAVAAAAAAQGDATGDLVGNGRIRGDISMQAGETDRITLHLVDGAALSLRVTAGFPVRVTLTDPTGAPVDLGVAAATRVTVSDHPVATSGAFTLAIDSPTGAQGLYTATVTQRWPRSSPISGTGTTEVPVSMPAAARFTAVVRGATGAPDVVGVRAPGGEELLPAPLHAGGPTVRVPAITTSAAGVYRLTIAPADPTGAWSGTVRRRLPFVRPSRLDVRNGLDAVSFAGDGVAQVFRARCSGCHGWAGSYGGARALASRALPRIKGGVMPPGFRLPAAEIALIQAWVSTGKQP